jgi:cyclic pyranopterin phosphate synthase
MISMNKKKPENRAGGRIINYLRLSITDRCNLRCMYCMPEEGIHFRPHSEILSYEEILRFVNISVRTGIRKVRLTGGEPLVRKGLIGFLEELSRIQELDEITITTNGILLKEMAAKIKACGISRLNVSLDSLKPDRFRRITGRDQFNRVWEGILEAERQGFDPIKINVVAIRGVNDDEILDFARLSREKPYHIRFIELMPVGKDNGWSPEKFISEQEIRERIQSLGALKPLENHRLDGPAQRYVLEGGRGEIGLIGAMSNHFCDQCNRLRLTAEGRLRSCLFSDQEIDIKTPLRSGKDDEHLRGLIMDAIRIKPENHGLMNPGPRKCVRHMSSIGG